eukprot:GHVH01014723.1.p1 GENE.GHVH01014723.1~~GHVH01014723.1.p1  ORF type:complete len:610 (+),score=46.42 GHVH01014723.1:2738-4567(+)
MKVYQHKELAKAGSLTVCFTYNFAEWFAYIYILQIFKLNLFYDVMSLATWNYDIAVMLTEFQWICIPLAFHLFTSQYFQEKYSIIMHSLLIAYIIWVLMVVQDLPSHENALTHPWILIIVYLMSSPMPNSHHIAIFLLALQNGLWFLSSYRLVGGQIFRNLNLYDNRRASFCDPIFDSLKKIFFYDIIVYGIIDLYSRVGLQLIASMHLAHSKQELDPDSTLISPSDATKATKIIFSEQSLFEIYTSADIEIDRHQYLNQLLLNSNTFNSDQRFTSLLDTLPLCRVKRMERLFVAIKDPDHSREGLMEDVVDVNVTISKSLLKDTKNDGVYSMLNKDTRGGLEFDFSSSGDRLQSVTSSRLRFPQALTMDRALRIFGDDEPSMRILIESIESILGNGASDCGGRSDVKRVPISIIAGKSIKSDILLDQIVWSIWPMKKLQLVSSAMFDATRQESDSYHPKEMWPWLRLMKLRLAADMLPLIWIFTVVFWISDIGLLFTSPLRSEAVRSSGFFWQEMVLIGVFQGILPFASLGWFTFEIAQANRASLKDRQTPGCWFVLSRLHYPSKEGLRRINRAHTCCSYAFVLSCEPMHRHETKCDNSPPQVPRFTR